MKEKNMLPVLNYGHQRERIKKYYDYSPNNRNVQHFRASTINYLAI